jgi:acyl carrier protein
MIGCESLSGRARAEERARALLVRLGPELAGIVGALDSHADLQLAGVDSASLIELGLMIEEELGAPLSAGELDRLGTIAGIRSVIEARTADVSS